MSFKSHDSLVCDAPPTQMRTEFLHRIITMGVSEHTPAAKAAHDAVYEHLGPMLRAQVAQFVITHSDEMAVHRVRDGQVSYDQDSIVQPGEALVIDRVLTSSDPNIRMPYLGNDREAIAVMGIYHFLMDGAEVSVARAEEAA